MKKKNCLGILIACILGATVCVSPVLAVQVSAEEDLLTYSLNKSNAKADFIQDNLYVVRDKYNESVSETEEKEFKANFVEYRKEVYLMDKQEYAVYMDFDGNNGYLLVDKDNTLYEFETQGDRTELKEGTPLYYSSFDGFMFWDEQAMCLQRYDNTLERQEDLSGATVYAGQNEEGDGEIFGIEAYVSSRYPDYERDYSDWFILQNFNFHRQFNTSVYRRVSGTGWFSEGNCVLNATYSMMFDWRNRGYYPNLTADIVDYSTRVRTDPLFNPYGNGTYSDWEINTDVIEAMPQLYLDIRSYALNYDYDPLNGFMFKYVKNIAQNTATKYGYSITINQTSSFENAKSSLRNGKAMVIGVNGSETYVDHGMTIIGYLKYTYESGWWIFATTKTAYFFAVDDCWGTADGNAYSNHISTSPNTQSTNAYRAVWFDPNVSATTTYLYHA